MEDDSFTERDTEISWPDEQAGPYRVKVGWRLLGERWECIELTVRIAEEGEPRPLHTVDLRGLRLPQIVSKAAVVLHEELAARREQLRASQRPTSRSEFRKMTLERRRADEALRAAEPRKPGRPPVSDGELVQVARVYAKAYIEHRPPRQAVAEAFGLSPSAAAKRIARCREAGLMGPAEPGKAGIGGLLMGRGDADTLARQIARDEAMERRRGDDPEKGEGS